jgi:site-specific DNA-methyltransferase (adenine-specific)
MQLKRRFGKLTENICVFYKKQPTYNPKMVKHDGKLVSNKPSERNAKFRSVVAANSPRQQILPYKDNGWRYPCDILKFNREKLGSTIHPTQKPIALLEYLIKTYTNAGDTVLDNCIGSGTTAIACINTNRNYIGFEQDKHYCDIANERIRRTNNKKQI